MFYAEKQQYIAVPNFEARHLPTHKAKKPPALGEGPNHTETLKTECDFHFVAPADTYHLESRLCNLTPQVKTALASPKYHTETLKQNAVSILLHP